MDIRKMELNDICSYIKMIYDDQDVRGGLDDEYIVEMLSKGRTLTTQNFDKLQKIT